MTEGVQVLVVGGGPAGATTAAALAQQGLRVLVLEKNRFPRFHIGESLIPETYWTFERTGVLDRLKASDFTKKYSVQFISERGNPSRPFYFFERDPHESSVTWQVDRAEFDRMLLENAAEKGAEVRHGLKVERLLTAGERTVGVRGVDEDGQSFELRADVVVDASGLKSLAARQFGWVRTDPRLVKAAVYAHYENAHRDSGKDEGATLIIQTRGNRGWFWYIPLSRNRVSLGVVGEAAELLKGRGGVERVLEEEIAGCPAVRERLENATRATPVEATSDYTFRARRCAGDGLVLVGDAFGFLDPIYSSGVFLALTSAERAAASVVRAFEREDFSAPTLGQFHDELTEGMEAFRRLVYAFYTPGFSFANFVSKHPQHRERLIRVLIGDVFGGDFEPLFDALQLSGGAAGGVSIQQQPR